MGVQATVAWLNKNASTGSNTTTKNQPLQQKLSPPTWKKQPTPVEPKSKDVDAGLKRIRTPSSNGGGGGGRGVASMLSKFDSSGASTMRTVATARSRSSSVLSNKHKPSATATSNSIDTTLDVLISMFQDVLDQCQTAQDTIQQMQDREQKQEQRQRAKATTTTTTTSESDCALIRDYEIRIQYLSEKVEQLSAEHDDLEHQLAAYRDPDAAIKIAASTIAHVIDTPVSSDLMNHLSNDAKQRRTTMETRSTEESDQHDDYWNCLLDSYEQDGSVGTAITTGGEEDDDDIDHKAVNKEATSEELLFVQKQVLEIEKGAKLMFEYQARELQDERSQRRYLAQVVEKQSQLIHILEEKLSVAENNKDQVLLQEQFELQQVELEDKRALLGRLLDEREEILQQQHQQRRMSPNRSRSASVRSSIDILSEMSRTECSSKYPLSRTSSASLQQSIHNSTLGRSTPPLTAPPRDPLPPLPYKTSLSIRGSSYSATAPASNLSPATSWSSSDYASVSRTTDIGNSTVYRDPSLQQHQEDGLPAVDNPPSMITSSPSTSSPLINRQSTNKLLSRMSSRSSSAHPNTAFWKSWKHRLGSKS